MATVAAVVISLRRNKIEARQGGTGKYRTGKDGTGQGMTMNCQNARLIADSVMGIKSLHVV